jgi:hypothetical protein
MIDNQIKGIKVDGRKEISAAGFDYILRLLGSLARTRLQRLVLNTACVTLKSCWIPPSHFYPTGRRSRGWVDGKKVGKTATVWSQL